VYRARIGSITLLAAAAALLAMLAPASARAFHAGSTFDKPPGAGGGGSVYYAGTQLERGWDCTACHLDPPGKIGVAVRVDPPPIAGPDGQALYVPGQAYSFEITMVGEHAGLDRPLYNFNSLVVDIVDARGFKVGTTDGFAPQDFYQATNSTLLYGQPPQPGWGTGEHPWKFRWNAPEAGGGPVSVHLAAVDGDGAGQSDDGEATSDPFHDDVAMVTLRWAEGSVTASAPQRTAPWAIALGLAALGLSGKRRGRVSAPRRGPPGSPPR
jgi:hypothetical protein